MSRSFSIISFITLPEGGIYLFGKLSIDIILLIKFIFSIMMKFHKMLRVNKEFYFTISRLLSSYILIKENNFSRKIKIARVESVIQDDFDDLIKWSEKHNSVINNLQICKISNDNRCLIANKSFKVQF